MPTTTSHRNPRFPQIFILTMWSVVISVTYEASAVEVTTPGPASWVSFRHDLSQSGIATSTLPETLELLWEVPLGEQVIATAAIVGDHVYVPCLSGELVCLNRQTGSKVWSYTSAEKVKQNFYGKELGFNQKQVQCLYFQQHLRIHIVVTQFIQKINI